MKKIELRNSEEKSIINEELQKLIDDSRLFALSIADEEDLLLKIREGNHQAVDDLVKNSSLMICQCICKHPSNKHTIMEQFTFAQMHLKKLALSEINSTQRARYFRFEAFCVRQALIELA